MSVKHLDIMEDGVVWLQEGMIIPVPIVQFIGQDYSRLIGAYVEESAIAALTARCEALEKDAARYRKWRDLALVFKPLGHTFPDAMMAARTPAEIDAAVDASPAADGAKV